MVSLITSRRGVRLAAFLNMLSHVVFVILLLRYVMDKQNSGSSVFTNNFQWHGISLAIALLCYFFARDSWPRLNLFMFLINLLIACYTFMITMGVPLF